MISDNLRKEIISSFDADEEPISVLQVGAALFDGSEDRISALETWPMKVIGVEASSDEASSELTTAYYAQQGRSIRNAVLSDGSHKTFYITALRGCSSYLPPNEVVCRQYHGFLKPVEVIKTLPNVATTTLDDEFSENAFDYIRIDTQGSELEIMSSGRRCLDSVMAIECEVEFVEQYVGQPRFSEVEIFLRSIGFQFMKFVGFGSRPALPSATSEDDTQLMNQWLWADALFVRDVLAWPQIETKRLKRLGIILDQVYDVRDFALRAFCLADRKLGEQYAIENELTWDNSWVDLANHARRR